MLGLWTETAFSTASGLCVVLALAFVPACRFSMNLKFYELGVTIPIKSRHLGRDGRRAALLSAALRVTVVG